MSHFTVAVFTNEEPTNNLIDMLLEPFDENKEVRLFVSHEDMIKRVRHDIQIYNEQVYQRYVQDKEGYSNGKRPAHLHYLEHEFPPKLTWTDEQCIQDYIDDYILPEFIEEDVVEDGVYTRYNPQAKWDWYQVGGRWGGLLLTKNGDNVNTDKVSNLDLNPKQEDIDYRTREWEIVVENQPLREGEEREDYNLFINPNYYLKNYETKDNYVRQRTKLMTYAALTQDGKWYEQGQMGWFGMGDDTYESKLSFEEQFDELMKEYKDGWITIVDCHI